MFMTTQDEERVDDNLEIENKHRACDARKN